MSQASDQPRPDPMGSARALQPLIEATRDGYDEARSLPAELADALAASGLFRLWLPPEMGGAELPPLPLVAAMEALATMDSSVGWCATIAAGYARLSAPWGPAPRTLSSAPGGAYWWAR